MDRLRAYSYGSTSSAANDCEEGKAQKVWEARGTMKGLAIDVACVYWYPTILVLPLLIGVHVAGDKFTSCAGISTHPFVCEYTRAYMLAFPAYGTIALLALVGRDLLQKRFYYGLLRIGGVLEFGGNAAWKDPMIIGLCISCFHCLAFVLMACPDVLSSVVNGLKAIQDENVNPKEIKQDVKSLLVMVSFLVPVLLVTADLFVAYDIQQTLVPMSEYVSDADNQSAALGRLQVMNEGLVARVLGNSQASASDMDGKYTAVVKAYVEQKAKDPSSSTGKSSVTLLNSLWPAKFLKADETFWKFWRCFVFTVFLLMCYVGIVLLHFTKAGYDALIFGPFTAAQSLHLAVFVAHCFPFVFVMQAFANT